MEVKDLVLNWKKNTIQFKVELVDQAVDYIKKVELKTYKITLVIYDSLSDIKKHLKTVVITLLLAFELISGIPAERPFKDERPSQPQIERQLKSEFTKNQKPSKSDILSVRKLLSSHILPGTLSGGDLGKSSSPGARAKNAAHLASQMRSRSGSKPAKSGVADAWSPSLGRRSRTQAADRLGRKLNGRHGQGHFSGEVKHPNSNFFYGGCHGGPKSVKIGRSWSELAAEANGEKASQQSNPKPYREMKDLTGKRVKLDQDSHRHLLNKHGRALNVDDLLPPSQNQKPTKWPQTRTRINKQNLETSAKRMEEIINSPRTDVYKNVNNRGIRSTVYHDPDTDTIIAVHTEGKFDGQIKKAQPISPSQLEKLITNNSIN